MLKNALNMLLFHITVYLFIAQEPGRSHRVRVKPQYWRIIVLYYSGGPQVGAISSYRGGISAALSAMRVTYQEIWARLYQLCPRAAIPSLFSWPHPCPWILVTRSRSLRWICARSLLLPCWRTELRGWNSLPNLHEHVFNVGSELPAALLHPLVLGGLLYKEDFIELRRHIAL